jgi:hypothetical protein
MKNFISFETVQTLIENYLDKGGEISQIEEGCLGYGTMVLSANGYKYAIIKEVFVNSWVSTHSIRFYNKLPKKFETIIINN